MKSRSLIGVCLALTATLLAPFARACTGITLRARDGTVVYGRTLEWGAFDMKSRLMYVPRGHEFVGATPDGKPGLRWKTQYGIVGIDVLEKGILADGINEAGMAIGLFYHPGYADYGKYDPRDAAHTIAPTQVVNYLLSRCATVAEVREAMSKVDVAPVVEKALGFPAPIHVIATEPSGKAVVIEFLEGEVVILDNPLGVITNAPTFEWHMTNLRNYINLSPVAIPKTRVGPVDFKPLGAGSGMIGLPGDFTPPSRFVRAVAFSVTARPTQDGPEALYEVLRILDNFNVPVGAAEGSDDDTPHKGTGEVRSSTLWTSVSDTKNRLFYYHTQHNRRVRMVDLKRIDFTSFDKIVYRPLDPEKTQDIQDVTLNAPAKGER